MPNTLPAQYTQEIGSAAGYGGMGGYVTPFEENPELVWPNSVRVFDQMRKTDGQIKAILRAIWLLRIGTSWKLMGDDVDPRLLEFGEAEFGLQLDQKGRFRKSSSGFDFLEHLRLAGLNGPIGHSYFEQIYTQDDDGKDVTGLPIVAHLSRLSWRPHRSIQEFVVDDNGDLLAIKQLVQRKAGSVRKMDVVSIPSKFLVAYVNEREGADWAGESWLRACWSDWNTAVKLSIFDAIGGERGSVGIPKVTFPTDGSRNEALAIAKNIRGGSESGVAIPQDWDVEIMGLNGSIKDVLPSIKYRDEKIGRTLLAMVLNLGHDAGAYSLGQTLYDLFCASLNAINDEFCEVFTERVIRPFYELNFGPDTSYPVLVADEITPEATLSPEQLKALVDAGVIKPDDQLEDDRRRRFNLPPADRSTTSRDLESIAPVPDEGAIDISPQPLAASRSTTVDLDRLQQRTQDLLARIQARS